MDVSIKNKRRISFKDFTKLVGNKLYELAGVHYEDMPDSVDLWSYFDPDSALNDVQWEELAEEAAMAMLEDDEMYNFELQ